MKVVSHVQRQRTLVFRTHLFKGRVLSFTSFCGTVLALPSGNDTREVMVKPELPTLNLGTIFG